MDIGCSPDWNSGNVPSNGMSTLLPQSLRAAMAFETSPRAHKASRRPSFTGDRPEGGTSAAGAIAGADWLPTQGSGRGNPPPPPRGPPLHLGLGELINAPSNVNQPKQAHTASRTYVRWRLQVGSIVTGVSNYLHWQ